MENAKELARKICLELGIEWDEKATVPTLQGEPMPVCGEKRPPEDYSSGGLRGLLLDSEPLL